MLGFKLQNDRIQYNFLKRQLLGIENQRASNQWPLRGGGSESIGLGADVEMKQRSR